MSSVSVGLRACTSFMYRSQLQKFGRPLTSSRLTFLKLCRKNYSSSDLLSSSKASSSVQQTSEKREPPDYLLQNIRSSSDVSHVLSLLRSHVSIMNNKHIMQALKNIFELQKSGCTSLSKSDIIDTEEFRKLCTSLKSQCRSLTLSETLNALKALLYLEVPSDSKLVLSMLQLIRHRVNDLNILQIIFLDFLLKHMEVTPLVEALNIALPFVFEAQVKVRIDKTNLLHLTRALMYSVEKRLTSCSEMLFESIYEIRDDIKYDYRAAKEIVVSICNLKTLTEKYEELLTLSLDALTKQIRRVPLNELEYIVMRLADRFNKRNSVFYHEDFLNNVGNRIVNENCGFQYGSRAVRKFVKFCHVHTLLLDYLSEKAASNFDLFDNCKPEYIMHFVNGLSAANYKPENWTSIQESMLQSSLFDELNPELPWIAFGVHLAVLGCFPTKLLEQVFSTDYIYANIMEDKRLDQMQLLLLYQAVFCLHPEYSGPYPEEKLLQKAINVINTTEEPYDFPFQKALEKGLGGSEFLQTRVSTRLGHVIDHVVIMRKGGYPVAINEVEQNDVAVNEENTTDVKGRKFLEDLFIPDSAQGVLIFCRHSNCYSNNCLRPKGHITLEDKTLEALGYSVVSISYDEWSQMPDSEKIPFLMRAIKLAYDSSAESEIEAA